MEPVSTSTKPALTVEQKVQLLVRPGGLRLGGDAEDERLRQRFGMVSGRVSKNRVRSAAQLWALTSVACRGRSFLS
jgi:hypothetical protein